MKMYLFFGIMVLSVTFFSCQEATKKSPQVDSKTTSNIIEKEEKTASTLSNIGRLPDILTKYEAGFFKNLTQQEGIPYSDNVVRYFKIEKGDTISIKNELIFEKEDGFINDEYSFFTLNYNGELDNMTINYDYVVGLADQGSGTIIVLGDHAIHTQRSCGTTTCCTTVKKNGKIEFEKCD